MKKNILVLGVISLLAALVFAACQKHSSSSSASGSVSAAVGNLTNLALSYSSVTPASISPDQAKSSGRLQPKAFETCAGITFSDVIYAPYGTPGSETGCPNSSTDTEIEYSGNGEIMSMSSCTAGGYTFYGQLNLTFSPNELICINSAGSVDSISGQIDLTSSNMEISGNGLTPSTCTVSVPLTLGEVSGTPTGTASNASACGGNPFLVTAQQ